MTPTSSTEPRPCADAGLTLLELLAVVAVMALLLLAVPRLGGGTDGRERAARAIAATLAEARAEAVRTAEPVAVAFDIEGGAYGLGAAREALPEGVALAVETAAEAALAPDRPAILFLPDGSSTGGRVVVEAGGRASALTVRWLTGAIEHRTTGPAR
jgi:general secretion pathway protein H